MTAPHPTETVSERAAWIVREFGAPLDSDETRAEHLAAILALAGTQAAAEPADGFHVCVRHDFDIVEDPKAGCPKCNTEAAAVEPEARSETAQAMGEPVAEVVPLFDGHAEGQGRYTIKSLVHRLNDYAGAKLYAAQPPAPQAAKACEICKRPAPEGDRWCARCLGVIAPGKVDEAAALALFDRITVNRLGAPYIKSTRSQFPNLARIIVEALAAVNKEHKS